MTSAYESGQVPPILVSCGRPPGSPNEKEQNMDAITGRSKPLVRIWDRNFNLVYSGEGDIGAVLGQLTVTIDNADGTSRSGGRIASVDLI